MNDFFTQQEAKEVWEFALGERLYFGPEKDSLSDSAQFKLYCWFQGQMPYGVQKARTGDPDQWIANTFDSMGEQETIAWINERTIGGFKPN